MGWTRRTVLAAGAGLAQTAVANAARAQPAGLPQRYGLIGQITAVDGARDQLATILVRAAGRLTSCLSYVVSADVAKPDALWVTEVWSDKPSHEAALATPEVQAAIAAARPLIASIGARVETIPIGGVGLGA